MTRAASSRRGRVSVVTPPAFAPVTLGEVKAHLRIDHDDEDSGLLTAIHAAVGELDAPKGWLGRSLALRTLRLTLDEPPPPVVRLPDSPVMAVKKIVAAGATIYDADSGVGFIEADLAAEPALVWSVDGWPQATGGIAAMQIDYVAGYPTADDIPKVIKHWLLERVGELYRDREASVLGLTANRLPHFDRMLDNWRIHY